MTKTRRKFTAEQKAAIVRRHLKDKEPISSIAEELSIQPTQIHQWVALALEQVERAFEKSARSEKVSQRAEAKINELKDQRIKKLEEKLIHKCQRAPKRGQVRALSKGANWTRMGRLISIRGISLPSSRNRRCQTGSQWTKHRELRSFLLPG